MEPLEPRHENKPPSDEGETELVRRFVLDWKTIETNSNCFPELEQKALDLIGFLVGYLPVPVIYLPHESFVRAVIAAYQRGHLSQDAFYDEAEFHAKRIRNDDMRKGGWVGNKSFTSAHYDRYNSHLALYKQAARNRLCDLLEYEPALEHSLEAELFLRDLFESDGFYEKLPYGDFDYKAATIVCYREAFFLEGRDAADNSELVGVLYGASRTKPFEKQEPEERVSN